MAGAAASGPHADAAAPPGAERLSDHVRGDGAELELARQLLAATWVVDDLEALPVGFAGVAVTRGGRVWSAATA